MALNCFLFDTTTRRSWPSAMGIGQGDDQAARAGDLPAASFEARLPPGWTVKKTRAAILQRHPALANILGTGIGYRLMHRESEVLLAVLETLRSREIVGLGLHDGLLIPASRMNEATDIMAAVAREQTGHHLPVTSKCLSTASGA
jgi:hypothetical protein